MVALKDVQEWPATRWGLAALATMLSALIIGVPTGVVPTDLYTRMTPVEWWNWPVWSVSSVLAGLTAATYVRPAAGQSPSGAPRAAASTLLAAFAVGCPICNKLVVGVVGASGALSYWAPVQPLLGIGSVALLAYGLRVRLRGGTCCPVSAPPAVDES